MVGSVSVATFKEKKEKKTTQAVKATPHNN
jgi:hypothetical protein